MPVDLERVDDVAATVADLYAEAELALVRIVARYLARGLDSPDWAQQRLAQVGALRRAAGQVVAALAVDGPVEVRRAVAAAYRSGNAAAVADLADAYGSPSTASAARQAISSGRNIIPASANAVQALADSLFGDLRAVHAQILPQVELAYRRAIAGGAARVLAGGIQQRRAAQAAWAALVDRGITRFTSADGRQWRLHTWVEMAMRTAVSHAVAQATVDTCLAAGHRYVYVTDTPGECAICRPWEHKVLALRGGAGETTAPHARLHRQVRVMVAGTLDEALAAGLLHPQCRHRIRMYLPGVTRLSGRTADPAGDEARRRQRAIERRLRGWREREAAALTGEDRERAARYVSAWDAEMAAHIAATGVPRRRFRERPGAGHEAPKRRRADQAWLS